MLKRKFVYYFDDKPHYPYKTEDAALAHVRNQLAEFFNPATVTYTPPPLDDEPHVKTIMNAVDKGCLLDILMDDKARGELLDILENLEKEY